MTGPSSGRLRFGQEDLNLPQRLLCIFYAPRASFEAVVGRESAHDWLVPVLIACAVGLAAHQLTLDIVANIEAPAMQEQMVQMSEEEREQYAQGIQVIRTHGWMTVPIVLFISLVAVSAVVLLVARFLFNSDATYRQILVVKGYASLIAVPEWIMRTPLMLTGGSAEVHTGLGAFVPEEMAGTFAGRLLSAINFFDVWQLWVMAIGLAVMTGATNKKALITLLVLWGLWIAGGAAVESAASGIRPAPTPGADL